MSSGVALKFYETPLLGAYTIDLEPREDERGFFSRVVCQQEFADRGIGGNFAQQNMSWNPILGTMRGLHFQAEPNGENKLVRVTRGAIWDVIVDIRPESSTFKRWFGIELSAENRRQLYIPKRFAHGYITQQPNTEVFYQMSVPYVADGARGIFWKDPTLAIEWPVSTEITMSDRDKVLPSFRDVVTE
jgi:dTDP-4-dehydrorhamnose 3,5-epimerase